MEQSRETDTLINVPVYQCSTTKAHLARYPIVPEIYVVWFSVSLKETITLKLSYNNNKKLHNSLLLKSFIWKYTSNNGLHMSKCTQMWETQCVKRYQSIRFCMVTVCAYSKHWPPRQNSHCDGQARLNDPSHPIARVIPQ